jgi:hypothetical protein
MFFLCLSLLCLKPVQSSGGHEVELDTLSVTIDFDPYFQFAQEEFDFICTVTFIGGNPTPFSYNMSFGDGTPNATDYIDNNFEQSFEIPHSYSTMGNYTVNITVKQSGWNSGHTSTFCLVRSLTPLIIQ